MKKFLRYNSTHRLFFAGDWKLPKLNPIVSFTHTKNGKRTWGIGEPLWLFLLRQRLFSFAGKQRCPDRGEFSVFKYQDDSEFPDRWDLGPDDNRTCSYCGSIHSDDLIKIAQLTLEDGRYGIEGTTKSYKFYIKQPGVRNASEGAIKFYMIHAPKTPTEEEQLLFSKALKVTTERFHEARHT